MAAACKTSKPDLVAIYRLEFYKKQKNWKFCTTERKKEEERRKAAKNAKAKLNQTYSIEPAPERDKDPTGTEKEVVKLEEPEKVPLDEVRKDLEPVAVEEVPDNLNEAFVDTETDDNTSPTVDCPPTGPYSPKWSIQQWAARCRPAWNSEPTYPDPQFEPSGPNPQHVWSDPAPYVIIDPTQPYQETIEQALTDYEEELILRKEMPHTDTHILHGAMLDTDARWGHGGDAGWPQHSQVWTNRHDGWFEEICDIPEEAIQAIEALEAPDAVDSAGAGCAPLQRPGDWLTSSASLDKGAIWRTDSLQSVSSGSFTRGAALAAQSTQLELSAGELSAPALASAVAEHAAALRALLSEARRRDIQVPPPPAEQRYSLDERPTRDVGPAARACAALYTASPCSVYTHNPTTINDVFVAGSHKNRPDLRGHTEDFGRGRGRKVRVVGIEMGRPYRL